MTRPRPRKTLSEANLAHLGSERLAALLFEAASADPLLKRMLRLQLAAAVGEAELAAGLEKRLAELAASRTRVSWRKRPELLRELTGLQGLIVDRLAPADATGALAILMLWFDLREPLQARTKDPRDELEAVFEAAEDRLMALTALVDPERGASLWQDALSTRASTWAPIVGRCAGRMDGTLARRLLDGLARPGGSPRGRIGLVVRRLSDRCEDFEIWLSTFDEVERARPAILIETAVRLARAGRANEARRALDQALVTPEPRRRSWQAPAPPPQRDDAWYAAEILVLQAEGRSEEASTARWLMFERTLSVSSLRDIVAGLPDFEDVIAIDRALAFASTAFDLNKALAFMMSWGAYPEAASTIFARRAELNGRAQDTPLWTARLGSRFPAAALLLLRARAAALIDLTGSRNPEGLAELLDEAEALSGVVSDPTLEDHAAFLASLQGRPPMSSRR